MKVIRFVSRLILGFVFIFSGFVKAIDPLGSSYKFADYFRAFHLDFLDSISLPLGIFLAAFELVLGIVLILGYQKRLVYWILLFFMGFFTILTFFLAIFNPVTDCGCFGDAVIMTNWQTFLKNILLMLPVLLLFNSRKRVENIYKNSYERILIILFFAGSFLLSAFCNRHLPLIDFRPYDVGTYIRGDMEIPPDAPMDEFQTTLIYRNIQSGETGEYTLETYPQDTLEWEFVSSESKLISKGYEPPIHDFGISDDDGFDYTDELLANRGYSLVMVSYDLEHADRDALSSMNDWNRLQNISGDFSFVPVTASGSSLKSEITGELGLEYSFYSADEIMLKTMIRSNPGFVLVKNGTILAKWAYSDFPELSDWDKSWNELLTQFEEEQDPEILMLIEEGYMEEVQMNVVDFDKIANPILSESRNKLSEKRAWIIFYISVISMILLLQIPALKRNNSRG